MQPWAALRAWAVVKWVCLPNILLLAAATASVGSGGSGHAALWRHVLVEPPWLKTTVTQTPRNLSLIPCGAACIRQDWCRLWCHEAPRGCLLTSLTASASYEPAQPDGALSCYTSRPPDLTVGANITSSPHFHPDIKRRENLVDGIFSSDMYDCAIVNTDNGVTPWFLLDLGATVPVSEVVLVTQPNEKAPYFFKDVEVRVGDVEMSGDFTTYQLLGTYPGPAQPEQTVVLRPAAPITGRYVSIQRTTVPALQIAHLEIR
ncbi:uncharacterized protein LOC126980948 [Eriocheir sinensis]|uniref:uncharacterized protein LOC126980948 n=1 Tax=Eriocheir sinensis TaxID=95602 RepID=UPI0021C88D3B|nr:uncharacterized protein LOC126980948 [Eriocheir sinensis]